MKLIISLVFIFLLTQCSRSNVKKSPRKMNGKTILRTTDSVYYITFRIDSVIPMEFDPKERQD